MFQFHREEPGARKSIKERRMSSWAATKNMDERAGRKSVY